MGRRLVFRRMALHPLVRHPLRLGDLSGRHLGSKTVTHLRKPDIVCVRRRQVHPRVSANIVLRHSVAVAIHLPEVELPPDVALRGGFSEPCHCLLVVLRDAVAIQVRYGQIYLRGGVPLISGLAAQEECLHVVLRHALAILVHRAKPVLRLCVPLFGQRTQNLQSGREVAASICGLAVLKRSCYGGAEQGEREKAATKESSDQLSHVRTFSGPYEADAAPKAVSLVQVALASGV